MASIRHRSRISRPTTTVLALFVATSALGACSLRASDITNPETLLVDARDEEGPMVTAVDPGMNPAYQPDAFEQFGEQSVAELGLLLQLPTTWSPVEMDNADWRFEGSSGFVHIRAVDNESGDIDELCVSEAHGEFQPFGTKPTLVRASIAGQAACQIRPSDDQMNEGNYAGAWVVSLPEPVTLAFGTYRFVLLNVDLPHLDGLGDAIAFA